MNGFEDFAASILSFPMSLVPQTPRETASALAADRAHTEMREDTAYQRAVADMRAAGLNPYTVGNGHAASSPSTVNAGVLANRLETLGYILNIANLSEKNRKNTNDLITDILGFFKKK